MFKYPNKTNKSLRKDGFRLAYHTCGNGRSSAALQSWEKKTLLFSCDKDKIKR